MKRCLACETHYTSSMIHCPNCDFEPMVLDGFDAYAPNLAYAGSGFKASYFAELARLETDNFWFRSRNRLILWMIEKYCPGLQSFLEIGCGTGYVLSGLATRFPSARLYGSEIFVEGLSFAAERLPSSIFMQMDAKHIPYHEEFDSMGAFDMLEHIEEDVDVLIEARNALNPNGVLFLTVPQHDWLWSVADEYACHVRRYSAEEIHRKLQLAGFHILRSTSFVSLLLPAMVFSRYKKMKPQAEFDSTVELKLPKILNGLFCQLMNVELGLVKRGVDFIAGGSRLVVAKKAG
ncbi:MAG: class I SAM-dependent methyltransferase [Magnetococcales bacterium]|nr:class I SAM-dependent methyltransferase [Magnetococcales bacterium]